MMRTLKELNILGTVDAPQPFSNTSLIPGPVNLSDRVFTDFNRHPRVRTYLTASEASYDSENSDSVELEYMPPPVASPGVL